MVQFPIPGPCDGADPQTVLTSQGHPSEEQALVTELLQHMAAGIAVLGDDLSLSSWNPRAEHITGYVLQNIRTTGLTHIFEPAAVMQHILRKAQEGIPTLSEYLHVQCADGQLIPVTVQCSPQNQQGSGSRNCQIVVVFRQLASLQERLHRDEHFAMLGRLASTLSHEIRNPLNTIFLHIDVLEEELQQPSSDSLEQMADSLTTIRIELKRLNDLVQDYLSLSRLSALQREPTTLREVVEAFAEEIQETLDEHNVIMHLEGLEALGKVLLHRSAFRRVLLNLVQNAMEAIVQSGTITLCGRQDGAQVYLEVRDTGPGITPDHLPLLFTPFYSTKSEGTGLGLYVIQQIIKAHGGKVTVHSDPERGTTFSIGLPVLASTTPLSE